MKRSLLMFAGVFLLCGVSGAFVPPHLPPDASGEEYRWLLEHQLQSLAFKDNAPEMQPIIDAGARNLDWLKQINAHRDTPLSFTSPATIIAYPITAPKVYNDTLVLAEFAQLKQEMPKVMADVLFAGAPLSDAAPLPEPEYLDWALKMERIYESAARWRTMQSYLIYLEQARTGDLRGYYALVHDPNRDHDLERWPELSPSRQGELRSWLGGICLNEVEDEGDCDTQLAAAESANQVNAFYQRYIKNAQSLYDSYFKIPRARHDVSWPSANEMVVPFVDPGSSALAHFLKDNIEDEWKWLSWKLILNLVPEGQASAHMVFQPGVTPHVNGIAGNEIVMDANSPLTDYATQGVIRHEFGHVLGFIDCYLEFYEPKNKWIVNYQLDTSNIMCSRKGRVSGIHYDELKRVYANAF